MKALLMAGALGIAALCSLNPARAADNPFAPPPAFAPDIQFWTRIYTEVGTDGGLLHDDRYLGVVYEVMKFPGDLAPSERSRRITAAKDKYRATLKRLGEGDAGDGAESRRVRTLWPADTSTRQFAEGAERIRFQLGQANRFREGLVRSGAYEAHIAETLANLGLPPEIAALPHVESSFDPRAYSHAGAAGLWQFIRSTGRRYMRIDADVDERMDPYRSTVAAAQFLKFNYELLGSWPLALTAYNHGPAGMRRAKEAMGTDDIVTISRRYSSRTFGFASRNYYIAFLAALQVDHDPEKYFGNLERHSEVKTHPVVLPAYFPVAAVESAFSVQRDLLRSLNPALTSAVWKGDRYIPRGFELHLPEGAVTEGGDPVQLLAGLAPNQRFNSQKAESFYRVGKGETLASIASKHGTTVAALTQVNSLRRHQSLRRGQRLRLPEPGEPAATAAVRVAAAAKPAAAGPVPPATPAKTPAPAAQPVKPPPSSASTATAVATAPGAPAKPIGAETYIVKRGDSISDIAKRAGMSEVDLMRLNRISTRNFIYEGQRLRLASVMQTPAEVAAAVDATAVETATTVAQTETPTVVTDKEIEREENAEPVAEGQAETTGPAVVAAEQNSLSADPSDYSVDQNLTIEVQAAETLGHYAEWLDMRASDLRTLNKMRKGQPVVIGRRVQVELAHVSVDEFERRRRAYHQTLQAEFFAAFRISGTQIHVLRRGETLWGITQKYPNIPIWLLRQHNPDIDFGDVHPGTQLVLPLIEAATADNDAVKASPKAS